MNNNFIVEIPKELKSIKSKLIWGLTKRQLIAFIIAIVLVFPTFKLLVDISVNLAMYASFALTCPVFFITVYKNNNLVAETWIKLLIEYKFIYNNKRKFKIHKKNINIARQRGIINVRKTKHT
jgi:hypothetical protein